MQKTIFWDPFCRPLSRNLGKMGFCHSDLWCNNMLKKGDAIIAIDFETASTGKTYLSISQNVFVNIFSFTSSGPALLDLSSALFAFRFIQCQS